MGAALVDRVAPLVSASSKPVRARPRMPVRRQNLTATAARGDTRPGPKPAHGGAPFMPGPVIAPTTTVTGVVIEQDGRACRPPVALIRSTFLRARAREVPTRPPDRAPRRVRETGRPVEADPEPPSTRPPPRVAVPGRPPPAATTVARRGRAPAPARATVLKTEAAAAITAIAPARPPVKAGETEGEGAYAPGARRKRGGVRAVRAGRHRRRGRAARRKPTTGIHG